MAALGQLYLDLDLDLDLDLGPGPGPGGGRALGVAGGHAINGTNADVDIVPGIALWNTLVDKANGVSKASGADGAEGAAPIPHLQTIPFWVMYIVATISEAVFWFCCGHVPGRRHPLEPHTCVAPHLVHERLPVDRRHASLFHAKVLDAGGV